MESRCSCDQSSLFHPDESGARIMNIHLISEDDSVSTDTHYGAGAKELSPVVIHLKNPQSSLVQFRDVRKAD